MEIDDESDSSFNRSNNYNNNRLNSSVNNCGLNSFESFITPTQTTHSLNRRMTPNSIGVQNMTPTKMLLNSTRRSSSGIFISSMFGSRFRHLQKLHSDAFLGLNAVCLPGLPVGAVFRSSLPATPVATPIHPHAFQQFSEQSIRERLCRTPSPRKNREFLSLALQQRQQREQQTEQSFCHQMSSNTNTFGDSATHERVSCEPMDITTPIIDEPVIEDVKEDDNMNGSGIGDNDFGHNLRLERMPSDPYKERRLFVGNISYRVCEDQ